MAEPLEVDFGVRIPTPEEIGNAAEAMTAIEINRETDRTLQIGEVKLSAALVDMVSDLFTIIARGDTVTYAPLSRQLTTQEAADLLNVSRPHLIKLIDRRELAQSAKVAATSDNNDADQSN